ncbi:di-trans,poly-cis-decaprenylcistransferase [bacterium]|nr:di-trans,poly-cis-decaprenylcistransferase [bacterium]
MADLREIDTAKPVPRHVAIIMDGNGRWAQQHKLRSRLQGHEAGAESVRAALRACDALHVRYLTLFAFSYENWKRPKDETDGLMRLLSRFIEDNIGELMERGIRLRAIGRLDLMPADTRAVLDAAIARSRGNAKLDLVLALSYGARQELVDAARSIAAAVQEGGLSPAAITEQTIASRLYAPDVPDPDLLIRTSGEFRVSNFLLWQISYTELYVAPVLWPDFREEHFYDAVRDYQRRDRRYGGR